MIKLVIGVVVAVALVSAFVFFSNDSPDLAPLPTVPTGCIPSNPLLTVSQQGSSQSGSAGSALFYTFDVTNRDGILCSSSSFDLIATIPQGWSGGFSVNPVTLPIGVPTQMIYLLISDLNAPRGFYSFGLTIRNRNQPSYSWTYSNLTYIVT
ncbi:MAG: hypothetical protein AABW89_04805 [Nanoarchaeota archaeon]